MGLSISYRDILRVKITRKNASKEIPEVLRLLYLETGETARKRIEREGHGESTKEGET
jgi:hypothetical protein